MKYCFNNGNIRSAITVFKERKTVINNGKETYQEFR